ncbi:MAG: L,D-transpeptidase family protein, partial [Xanthobacteraceae bacterium]
PDEETEQEPEAPSAVTPLDAAPDTTEAAVESAAETPVTEEAAPATEATEPAASDDATDAEQQAAAEPPPLPAHPIVAEARQRLADPEFQKNVDSADLKGLEAFYNARTDPPLWVSGEGFSSKAQDFIAEIEKADDWGLDASAFHLPPPNDLLATQNAQADDELMLSAAILKYARHAQGGRRTPSKISPLFDQKPPIEDADTVLTGAANATDASAYLASLHPQHEQFKRLREALLKARAKAEADGKDPNTDRDVQLITINMERWRWMPRSLGAYHVWNNVPAFNTRVVKNGKTIYTAKTIVGQFKYATPFFSSPMRNIVFHPDWTVPTTILKEDLAPRLQGPRGFFGNSNTEILRQHDLRVSFKGEPVDPDEVDWNNVNIHQFTFTQPPGPANVLGELKFNFPNSHAIYMHDTPQRELFAERVRTLSHGCIRVNEPSRLAAVLLGEDKGWSQARVDSLLAGNESTVVPLNRPVPVHLTYFTAVVDEDGKLEKLGDIYGIDNRMAAAFFKKPVRFEVPATPAIAEAGSAPQGPQGRDARRARGGGGLDDLISGLFGN